MLTLHQGMPLHQATYMMASISWLERDGLGNTTKSYTRGLDLGGGIGSLIAQNYTGNNNPIVQYYDYNDLGSIARSLQHRREQLPVATAMMPSAICLLPKQVGIPIDIYLARKSLIRGVG